MNTRPLPTLLLACSTLACSDLGPQASDLRDEVARNRARWEAVGPTTYVYAVAHNCFCPMEAVGPVRVEVEAGEVIVRTYVQSGTPVDPTFAEVFPAVDGLFDVLDRAIEQEADDIQVTWDQDTGAPLQISIDYLKGAVDDEEGYSIVDGPRTTP